MKISVVIPTYTGVEHIEASLRSIVEQTVGPDEVVIVIDGPGKKLRQLVETAVSKVGGRHRKIKFLIHQNKRNSGRFKARQKGAQLAGSKHLVFLDDRVELKRDYIATAKGTGESIVIPDVEERVENGSLIEQVNSTLRHKLFDKYAGRSYAILPETFDDLPKGTSGLWVPRQWFLDACDAVAGKEIIHADTSDDTKLLRALVTKHGRIFHENKAIAYYSPREKITESVSHLFQRGPKFVDYYLKPGRRYFTPLLIFYSLLALGIIFLVLYPVIVVALLIISAAVGLWLTSGERNFLKVWLGLWLVGVTFGAGLVWGLFKKMTLKRI